jgi:hypothetical protein
MTKASKYFTGMYPKRGFTKQFKELDAAIHELNNDLTHYVIQVNVEKKTSTKAEIQKLMTEIKQYALGEIEEEKRFWAEQQKIHGISSLGPLSNAIKRFSTSVPSQSLSEQLLSLSRQQE